MKLNLNGSIRRIELGRKLFSTNNEEIARTFAEKLAAVADDRRRFEYEHQRTIGLATVPTHAPKSSKEIAEARPWDGSESLMDSSRRLLEDSIKPVKLTRSKRLSNARENVLDYTLNKSAGPSHNERLVSSRRTSRVPRASASSGLSSGGWIESIASQEIENAIASKKFEDISRGTAAKDGRDGLVITNRNPQLDLTEYIMNNIIKKQGGAPPWIMKQKAVKERIERFREQNLLRLQERLVHRVTNLAKNNAKEAIRLAKSKTFRDEAWEASYAVLYLHAINDINMQIRGYNLQAPPTARRGYLSVENEIERCYASVTVGIEKEIERYIGIVSVPKADSKTLHSSVPPMESPDKHYGLKQLLKDLFGK